MEVFSVVETFLSCAKFGEVPVVQEWSVGSGTPDSFDSFESDQRRSLQRRLMFNPREFILLATFRLCRRG